MENIKGPEEAVQRFEKLSLTAKKILNSDETHTLLERLEQKYKLHIDQLGTLETEVMGVALGYTDMNDFPTILEEQLHLSPITSLDLTREINELLFLKIRAAMKTETGTPNNPTADISKELDKKDTPIQDIDPYREPIE